MTSAFASRRVFAVVPAAGRGARFDPSAKRSPKQYAPLLGATVIEWSLRALMQEPRIEKVVVAVAADDMRWPALAAAIGLAPGDEVEWELLHRGELHLVRIKSSDPRARGGR